MKSVWWEDGAVCLLDQRRLPHHVETLRCETLAALCEAIRTLTVRGAPAIGIAAAYGMALASRQGVEAETAATLIRQTRPTAVNLFWAVDRVLKSGDPLGEAHAIAAEDDEACRAIGRWGAELIASGDTVLTHCNAGGLATSGYGTALGVLQACHEQGKRIHVMVDETRPLLQGARLTTFELAQAGIPHTLITDNMAASLMQKKRIDLVIVGADRIAANGDVANKIGTYGVAVLARWHQLPFYVAAPFSTFDLQLPSGSGIHIEERSPDEVRSFAGVPTAPAGTAVVNPAFDVTPADLVTAIITERGVLRPDYRESLAAVSVTR
ncbi:MAG TPA: S-methyl-5-thioribose-1-phosphate isomerase [Candidatus Xenobia bacterium]|jgi:methylthioribose-1-phosphate isomerase